MKCTHDNKVLIDWVFNDFGHTSTYRCTDCGDRFVMMDCPIIYKYPPTFVRLDGQVMHEEDYDIIMEKERIIKENEGKL